MERSGPDFRVHKNGSFIIKAARKHHDGYYHCVVKNRWGSKTSPEVRLTVEGIAKVLNIGFGQLHSYTISFSKQQQQQNFLMPN